MRSTSSTTVRAEASGRSTYSRTRWIRTGWPMLAAYDLYIPSPPEHGGAQSRHRRSWMERRTLLKAGLLAPAALPLGPALGPLGLPLGPAVAAEPAPRVAK